MGRIVFQVFHCLPNSACADGNLAGMAGQLGQTGEHPNQSQHKPGPRPPDSPCVIDLFSGHLLLVVERGHRGPVHQSPRRVGRDEGIVLVVLTCKM